MNSRKSMLSIIIILLFVLLSSCANMQTSPDMVIPESDSEYIYKGTINVDTHVYTIVGEVAGDLNTVVRQTSPASGSMGGYSSSGFGYVSGVYHGAEFGGKTVIRFKVLESNTSFVPAGKTVILKAVDIKAAALLPGDYVTFRCRKDTEAIAAVYNYEPITKEHLLYELDDCRLLTGILGE